METNGWVLGVTQTIVGHPLDTLKTWKQSNIKTKISLSSLYRGAFYPFISSVFLNQISFDLLEYNRKNKLPNYLNYLSVGVLNGIILTPLEYWKVREQHNLPKSIIPKGFGLTLMREIPGASTYFYCLDYTVKNKINPFLGGGMAGICSWLITYPIDVFKTRYQVDVPLKEIIRKPWFTGLSYCLLRSFLTNGIGFLIFRSLT